MTAARLLGLLRERHSDPEWMFFENLHAPGDPAKTRYLDGFAFNLWASKKYLCVGYEIKVSRGDLLAELVKEPEKREAGLAVCNQFYYVVPKGLIDLKELPKDCGLIEANAGGLRMKLAAPYRKVEPPGLPFIVAMFQRLKDYKSVPVACFKYAGREMTELEFRKVVEESLPAETDRLLREKVEKAIERWERTNEVAQVIKFLREEIHAYRDTLTLADVETWLRSVKQGIPAKKLEWAVGQMEGLIEVFNRILEKIPHAGDPEGEANPVQRADDPRPPGEEEKPDPAGG
jgi:hypothetical protein